MPSGSRGPARQGGDVQTPDAYQVLVATWLASGAVGLVLAVAGLHGAQQDRRAVLGSGRNGLMLHMCQCHVRSWLVRIALSVAVGTAGILIAGLPAPVLPVEAGPEVVVRLYAARCVVAVVGVITVWQSAQDLRGRRRAGEIAGGGH